MHVCREELEFIANTLIFILAGVIIAGNIYLSQHTADSPVQIRGQDYGYAILLWVVLIVRIRAQTSWACIHGQSKLLRVTSVVWCLNIHAHMFSVSFIVQIQSAEEKNLSSAQVNSAHFICLHAAVLGVHDTSGLSRHHVWAVSITKAICNDGVILMLPNVHRTVIWQ